MKEKYLFRGGDPSNISQTVKKSRSLFEVTSFLCLTFFFNTWGKKDMDTNKVSISDYTFNFVPVVSKGLVSL